MTIQRGDYLIGVFDDQAHAIHALHALQQGGFKDEQLTLVARECIHEVSETIQVDLQRKVGEGATRGAAVGAGVGATAGAVAAALIPGLGPLLAGSLLTVAVGGAALGAALGTFAGPFIALGVAESTAQQCAQHVEAGCTVVLVEARDRRKEARAILRLHGAYDDSMHST